jgi:photosystem II stability/assembly factor-like uncharacterized protein
MTKLIFIQSFVVVALLYSSCTVQDTVTLNVIPNSQSHSNTGKISTIAFIESGLENVVFLNSNEGWGIQNGNLVQTTDGGRSWITRLTATTPSTDFKNINITEDFKELAKLQPFSVIAIKGGSQIYINDGGSGWRIIGLNNVIIRDFSFINANLGWLVGQKRSERQANWLPTLYSTNDGGQSWVEKKVENISLENGEIWWDVWADSKNVWLVGDRVLRSADNGKTWNEVSICEDVAGTPAAISFLNDKNGWLMTNQGSKFCVTADGGHSWMTRDYPKNIVGVRGITQVDPEVFWAFGENGAFISKDGGSKWEKVIDGKFFAGQFLREENKLILAGDRLVMIQLPFSQSF